MATKRYERVPNAERCECCVRGDWHTGRCDRRAKYTVIAYPEKAPYPDRTLSGEPREIRVCGVHRTQANKGKDLQVYKGPAPRPFMSSVEFVYYYPKATDLETYRADLRDAEMHQKWNRGNPASARTQAGRAMFEQAPEILEMLFMVAERGDQRAWAAIETIQQGMSDVEKADAEYQALVDKIEALKAKIEQAKGEQA